MAHTILAAAFVLPLTRIGKHAMKKFGICMYSKAQCIFYYLLTFFNLNRQKKMPLERAQRYLTGVGLGAKVYCSGFFV